MGQHRNQARSLTEGDAPCAFPDHFHALSGLDVVVPKKCYLGTAPLPEATKREGCK